MASGSPHPLQRLLDEAPYLRALAGALAAAEGDDVAQTAWVRALEHDAPVARPRAWLAQVVRRVAHNLRRASRRRARHEQVAAHPDLVPSSADLMEREERRGDLVRAVDALPEPLRAVVLLRYFEELPPRAIAARLGLPVTTVWNRLRTALARLRQELEARHGDRRAFLLPLLPASRGIATGMLALSAKSKVLGSVALAAAAILTLWGSGIVPLAPLPGPALPEPVAPMSADRGQDARTQAPAPERAEVESPTRATPPSTGTLIVHAKYPRDGASVADLVLTVGPVATESRFEWRRARTDEHGIARIEGLTPGEHMVSSARNWRSRARATVIAGAEQRVELSLPDGIRITGIVVDADGVAVAGAEVHVAPSLGQRIDLRPLALTGADGRFDLRSCSERCVVGARAVQHAPSWMHYVNLQEGGSIDLRLELPSPGGVVEGTVFGVDRAPLADAAVVIGEGLADVVRTTNEGAPAAPAYVYTDANGRFRAVGLPPGDLPVEARARGYGLWVGSCRVDARRVTAIEVTLQPGFACTGVVRDAAGAPVAKADVNVGSRGRLGWAGTRTLADGTFRLDGLAPGDVEVVAYHSNVRATAKVRGGPGETVACELRLDAGLALRGRVLRGATPVVEAYVYARAEGGAAHWTGLANTDADGRFVLRGCPQGRTLTLQVGATGHRLAALPGVDPRSGDVLVQLEVAPPPSVKIRGRITGPDGRPVPQANVAAEARDGLGTGLEAATDEGSFALGPLIPGRWRVCVQVPGSPWVWSEWRELPADAEWDLGEVRLPVPGSIAIRTQAPAGLAFHLVVFDAALALGSWAVVDRDGDRFQTKPLAPGLHYVMAVGDEVAARFLPVEVRAGEDSTVDLTVERGHQRRFEIHCDAVLTELHLRILQDGVLVAGSSAVGRTPGAIRMTETRSLAPGDYLVTARGDGRAGEAHFTVREGGDEVVRIEMR